MLSFLFGSKDKRLVRAAEAGNLDEVRALLAKGASANAVHDGTSALVTAVAAGHAEIARVLLDAGADPNRSGDEENDVLSASIMAGAEELTALLLERGANTHTQSEAEGHTVLHLAAGQGTEKQVALLLARGMSVDARTDDGRTPLFEACYWGKFETARFLLERGADPNALGRDGATPLAALVTAMRMWTLRDAVPQGLRGLSGLASLGKGIRDASEAALAVPSGMLPLIDLLVARGADPGVRDGEGTSILERARREGAPAAVLEKLVAVGASV